MNSFEGPFSLAVPELAENDIEYELRMEWLLSLAFDASGSIWLDFCAI